MLAGVTVRVGMNGLAGWLAAVKRTFDPQLAALRLTAGQSPVVEHDPAALSARTVVLYFGRP